MTIHRSEPLERNAERPKPGQAAQAARGSWALRDHPTTLWLGLAFVVAVAGRSLPEYDWLLVHLVLLGALTHAVMVWSTYFAQALLKTKPSLDGRRQQSQRLALLLVGTALVLIGVPTTWWWVTVVGATTVTVAVTWHAVQLWRRLHVALPGRFRVTLYYYLVAAACLPVGATFGALLAREPADPWHAQLLVAHSLTMVLGWIGLTVTGTLLTLWPTMLRTRMDDRAEMLARQSLPVLVAALVAAVTGALPGVRVVTVAGLLAYLGGFLWWGRSLREPTRRRPPQQFATVSVGCALVWFAGTLAVLTGVLAFGSGWVSVGEQYVRVAAALAVGFGLQLMMGALSYLIPVVLGGGPAVARATGSLFDRFALARIVVVNVALAVCLLPVPELVRMTVGLLGVVALATFLPLAGMAVRESVRARRALLARLDDYPPRDAASGDPSSAPTPKLTSRPDPHVAPSIWSPAQLVAAVSALALAITIGVGLNPSTVGLSLADGEAGTSVGGRSAGAAVVPTGHTTTVQVEARDMRFHPASVSVPLGDRLVIHLVNTDETTTHDLVLATGARTSRLATGSSTDLDAGVISGPVNGWCSVIGHRQMGMVFRVEVTGGSSSAASGAGTMAGMSTAASDSADVLRSVTLDSKAAFSSGFTAYDPVLPALGPEKVHKVTLTVEELELEVAPGVWQKRWTYNGSSVGPALHGRVGDTFEITLVNHGSMGHSIDFHAGSFAPDDVIKTIPPGQSLSFSFTANRAGIWMYHCSSMPMSAHIAAGMAGAVVIEPPGLAPVARSYLLVQSEVYLGADTAHGKAGEVNADKVSAEKPDAVVFNGVAFQYDRAQLSAAVGERVRFWVLDVGPNRSMSFHIVGAQFDTVYAEGAWLLRPDASAGGSQALSLGVSQGGFVETVFTAAGHYPFVNHAMVDAERGAHGFVTVTS